MQNSYIFSFKRYWHRLLGLALGSVLLFFVASMALVKYAVEPHDHLIKSLTLIRSVNTPNAAFGDSHMVWGFVGSPDFPILGMTGETISDMEERVRFYFQDKRPGKVIIQGDPHSFAPYKLARTTHGYIRAMDGSFLRRFVDHHRQYVGRYWSMVFADRSFDVFRPKHEMEWGWVRQSDRWSALDSRIRVRRASERVARQVPALDFQHHAFAESYRSTLAYLKSRGAEVCVVTTPVSQEYLQYVGDNESVLAAIQFFREAAGEFSFRYINFFSRYAPPEFSHYFMDADHLNEIGASRFTGELLSSCFGSSNGSEVAPTTADPLSPGHAVPINANDGGHG